MILGFMILLFLLYEHKFSIRVSYIPNIDPSGPLLDEVHLVISSLVDH